MDLRELEHRNLKQPQQKLTQNGNMQESDNEIENDFGFSDGQNNNYGRQQRSANDWKLIIKLTAALSVCIGLILGFAAGFPIGRITAPTPTVEIPEENENSIYSQYDYTQFVINADKGVTIDSFYTDDEEKYYAMQLIGTEIPSLKYLDSTDTEHTTTDLGSGRYIIEFFEPQCTFCNSMIDTIDKYRETEGAIPIIGLSIQNGDISKFNKKSENSFMLVNKDSATDSLVSMIRWIPTFIYVENGEIKLVTFGVLTTEEIENNVSIAFTPTAEIPEENEIEIGG